MDVLGQSIFQFIVEIVIFLLLIVIGVFIFKKIRTSNSRFLNPQEFLPQDEIHTLKQVFYLILMALCFIIVLYSFSSSGRELYYLEIFDIVLSLFVAITIDKSSWKNRILVVLLVPYGALSFLLFGVSLVSFLDLMHVPVFLYLIKHYYDKFHEYTESQGLTISIVLLFIIIFASFFITQIAENVNPLDSLVMVSNAFTSNGYSILGHSILGKINSIFLVWGGYIISGAGTATLTAAILIRHFNKRLDELEKIMEEGSDE